MSNSKSILLVEDDEKLAFLLKKYFTDFSFSVHTLASGEHVVEYITTHSPSLVILDLMLPDQDGLSLCRQVRGQYQGVILILTASGDDMDHVAALEIGADDFVHKPIQPRVLLARVKNLLRRNEIHHSPHQIINSAPTTRERLFGTLWLNNSLKRCKLNDELVPLTATEFELLWQLTEHSEQVRSREQLLKSLRNIEYNGIDRSIDNKIVQIRKKLHDNASRPQGIITVRNKGYMFIPDFWKNIEQ